MKKLIVILGCHRSGTSALSRTMRVFDFLHHPQAHESANDNLRGFWEDSDVINLNERALRALKMKWYHLKNISNLDVEFLINLGFLDDAKDLISAKFKNSNVYAFKDPRTTKLLLFWLRVINDLEKTVDAYFIFANRHPNEVASSIMKREKFGLDFCKHIYLSYTVNIFNHLSGERMLIINYDDLLKNTLGTLGALEDYLQIPSNKSEIDIYIKDFINVDLRNHLEENNCVTKSIEGQIYNFLKVKAGKIDIPWNSDLVEISECIKTCNDYERLYSITDKISLKNKPKFFNILKKICCV